MEKTVVRPIKELIESNEKEQIKLLKINDETDFYKSLLVSVKSSGASSDWITDSTTLKELAEILSVNNIRFTYKQQTLTR